MNTNQRISQDHEADLQARLGGRRTRGSGNQYNNPMDGRHSSYNQTFAFAWDGKATRSASVAVTQVMWDKAVEQAHHERPMLALRRYLDDRAKQVGFDLAVIGLLDLEEMLDHIDRLEDVAAAAREYVAECDSPAPDLLLRANLRQRMREALDG